MRRRAAKACALCGNSRISAFEDLAARVGVVQVPDMPGRDEAQPLRPPGVRLVGHLQQQVHLLEAEAGLVQVLGEQPGQPFAGGHVVRVALEDLDAGIGLLGRPCAAPFLIRVGRRFIQRVAQRGQGNSAPLAVAGAVRRPRRAIG